MKKIYTIIIFIILVIVCTGCKENNNLDLEDLYEKNLDLAENLFFGWGSEEFEYELIIFEPENANEFEIDQFSWCFYEGVEKLLYIRYPSEVISPYVVAIQFESVAYAQDFYAWDSLNYMINENIVALKISGAYMLLYGEYKEIDGYWLSLDGEFLLFDNPYNQRINMVIPEGVKFVSSFGLYGYVKSIKCNPELKILCQSAFAFLPSLEKVELNDGLKVIMSYCFSYHNLEYVVVPESVEVIGSEAFQDLTIYCEVEEKPWGWDKDFALDNCEVYWKGTWEYVDGVPQPITNEEVVPEPVDCDAL